MYKIKFVSYTCMLLFFFVQSCKFSEQKKENYDIVVYGATPGGVSAAVNAAREGMRVVLIQNDKHIGGLASGGLSNPDFRTFESLGGTYREFMQRIEQFYEENFGENSPQVINCVKGGYPEPHVAQKVFEDMLEESEVRIFLDRHLESIELIKNSRGENRIGSATFIDLDTKQKIEILGKIFIDGTYEGDLMAKAKVPFRVGRESQAEYNEELAPATGDHLVQAYNFRVVMTTEEDNQILIAKPSNYDRSFYEPLIKYIADKKINTLDDVSKYILRIRRMPNKKAEFNDVRTAPLSLSRTGINYDWPEGDREKRIKIFNEYKDWSLGLIYFLQNDLEVPVSVRNVMKKWGLPKDEYVETYNWSPALYVREGRRMIGNYIFTEHDTQLEKNSVRSKLQTRSVAISDYSINTHGVSRPSEGAHIGVIGRSVRPLQVPFDIMVPKETNGLLVPVALSASHVGFAALRYEPLWTALGQAAGIAAAVALNNEVDVKHVDVLKVQLRLHELGALTIYVSDIGEPTFVQRPQWEQPSDDFKIWLNRIPPSSEFFRSIQFFGTQGFFHSLIDIDSATNWAPKKATGQWALHIPYHDIDVTRKLDEKLGREWIKMAIDLGFSPTFSFDDISKDEMTRGQFLKKLFDDYVNLN